MHILFFKPDFSWPRTSGHDVYTYQMMRAMAAFGVKVTVATARPPSPEALAGVGLERVVLLDDIHPPSKSGTARLKPFEERFRSYWGVPHQRIIAFGQLASDINADAVVVSGLDVLPLLGAVHDRVRIWYAGDEWVWHHLSQIWASDVKSWTNLKPAAIKGLYERTFAARIDRAWAVSREDTRALRWIAGIANVDTIPIGVDARVYCGTSCDEEPDTAIFWGRLDFGPNIQALEWFVHRVWPLVHAARPATRFTIAGFHPGSAVTELARTEGVDLLPNVPDIRPVVARRAVVALPFVSGGGTKNKLLEAAAMGKAIVASPRALLGLRGSPPLRQARSPREWQGAMTSLWNDARERRALGTRARDWVTDQHTWTAAARLALDSIEQSLGARGTQ